MAEEKKSNINRETVRKIERDNRQEVDRSRKGEFANDHAPGKRIEKTTGWNETPPPPPKKNKT